MREGSVKEAKPTEPAYHCRFQRATPAPLTSPPVIELCCSAERLPNHAMIAICAAWRYLEIPESKLFSPSWGRSLWHVQHRRKRQILRIMRRHTIPHGQEHSLDGHNASSSSAALARQDASSGQKPLFGSKECCSSLIPYSLL